MTEKYTPETVNPVFILFWLLLNRSSEGHVRFFIFF